MKKFSTKILRFLAFASLVSLGACGGGSSASSSNSGSTGQTSNGSSGGNTGQTSNNPAAGPGKFAFVANSGSNNIAVLNINASGAPLTNNSLSTFSPYTTDNRTPVSLALDSTYGHIYVAETAGFVGVFSINSTTGALTEVAGSPYAAGNYPNSLVLDPTGNFLYVANYYSKDVSVYSVNRAAGTLTPVAGSPFSVGSEATQLAVDPANGYLYVVTVNNGINVFSVNGNSGVLSSVAGSPFAVGSGLAGGITFNATGKFAYVAGGNSSTANNLGVFAVNLATGVLTPISGSPFSSGTYSTSVVLDASNKFAYVPNENSSTISVYSVNSTTGALTEISGSPFSSIRALPTSISIDPTGAYAYVTNGGTVNSIQTFAINATTGALSILPDYLLTTQMYAPLSMVFY
jgi:6-phosphogluconolactonase